MKRDINNGGIFGGVGGRSSTLVLFKADIHKAIYKSPKNETKNQTDRTIINRRWKHHCARRESNSCRK